jgi:membrane protease YdiL (CAAX protease family)
MSKARVWIALVAPPIALLAAFIPFAAYLAGVRGVPTEELPKAMERIAAVPATLGFAAAFFAARALARRDGLTLGDLGWTRPTAVDLLVAIAAAALLAALNAFALYPRVQAAQPEFDPTLPGVSLPAAALTLVVAVVAEDTVFRGYGLRVLRERHGVVVAVAVTTVFYSLVTPGPGYALRLWTLYFGLVLCALRLWRQNLWPVAIAHALVSLTPKLLAAAGV